MHLLQACCPELLVAASFRPPCTSGFIQTFSYLEDMGSCVPQSMGALAFFFVSLEILVNNLHSVHLGVLSLTPLKGFGCAISSQ